MNRRLLSPLAAFTVSAVVLAQAHPPTGGQHEGPPRMIAAGAQTKQRTGSAASNQQDSPKSVYLKLLLRTDVQSDLAMTQAQNTKLAALFGFDGTKASYTDSEVLSKVSRALTADQIRRLKELAVQYLGYDALDLTEVQDALALTTKQKTEVQKILAAEQEASAPITQQLAVSAAVRQKNLSRLAQIRTEANAALAKVLTTEQDAQLKVLAGRQITWKAAGSGDDS